MGTRPPEVDPREMYNNVLIKNIDIKDFKFQCDSEWYMIPAGETRSFPKFIATHAMRKLIDKLANRKDKSGKTNILQTFRKKMAAKIFISEEKFDKPVAPSDREIVEKMQESDLDAILKKNKKALKTKAKVAKKTTKKKKTGKEKESFDGLKKNKKPTRAEMLDYAQNTLKMDIEDPETKKAYKKMTNPQLFKELGMGN